MELVPGTYNGFLDFLAEHSTVLNLSQARIKKIEAAVNTLITDDIRPHVLRQYLGYIAGTNYSFTLGTQANWKQRVITITRL